MEIIDEFAYERRYRGATFTTSDVGAMSSMYVLKELRFKG